MRPFIHLHTHSEFSPLDGLSRTTQMVEQAKAFGMPAIALTDHGNVAGAPEFYYAARKEDVVPILGQEFYIVPDTSKKDAKQKDYAANRHIVMLALNQSGWHTLVELTSLANLRENYHYKPRIDHAMVRDFAGVNSRRGTNRFSDVAVSSACLSGEVARALEAGGKTEADAVVKQYQRWFPNFYLELQQHPIKAKHRKGQRLDDRNRIEQDFEELQDKLNKYLMSASERLGIPIIITNDSHYATKDLADIHNMLLAMQTADTMDNDSRYQFAGTGYWIKTTDEMSALWRKSPAAWKASQKSLTQIVKQAKDIKIPEFDSTTWHIPNVPDLTDPVKELRKRCEKRMKQLGLDKKPVYVKRLKHELSVIREANFETIFMIVDDYVNWARDHGIIVGPGRGSMVGVLCSYLLGITEIDPVKYRLLFERAINPARPSIPDFDIDFESHRVDEVIEYVRQKYGEENVMLIGTASHMGPKGTIKSILRTLGVPFDVSNRVSAELPDSVEISQHKATSDLETIFNDYTTPQLDALIKEYPIIRAAAIQMQGLLVSFGKHAAGVVISDPRRNLVQEIPKMLIPSSNVTVSQYDMDGVKHLHLVKFDFLSISTLSAISQAIQSIGHNPFKVKAVDEMDDKATYKMMARGDLLTVFQFQGGAMKQCIQQMGVDEFEDLVAVNALGRPGSINFLPDYVRGKRDPGGIKYACKQVRPILEYTFGIILYQEQVMEIVKVLAGWDDLGADRIKEAIKSKSGGEFDQMTPLFIEGCIKNGITKEAALEVWKNIDDYRSYGFNRAHAVAYATIGYQTAYLKCHYPAEWLTAVLNTNNEKNFSEIIDEIRRLQVRLLLPDINRSSIGFSISKSGIRFGLTAIKGLGPKAAVALVAERRKRGNFKSRKDFEHRFEGNRAVQNKARMAALEQGGAFSRVDGVRPNGSTQLQLLGAYVTDYPLDQYRTAFDKALMNKSNKAVLDGNGDAPWVYWGGLIQKVKPITTKKGDPMCFATVSYYGETKEVVFFPDTFQAMKSKLTPDSIVLIKGRRDNVRNSIIAQKMRVVRSA